MYRLRQAHRHPELPEQTVWEVFEGERPKLVPYAGRFDCFHAVPASVSKSCLVRFDNNKYSVTASAVGRPVEVQAYADRIVIRQDGRIVAEHPRSFGRGETTSIPGGYRRLAAPSSGSGEPPAIHAPIIALPSPDPVRPRSRPIATDRAPRPFKLYMA
jgi:hypothetical protein